KLVRREGQWLCSRIDLDAGKDALVGQDLHQGCPVRRFLADRFVVEDHAADEVGGAGSAKQELTVVATVRLGALDTDRVETALDRARALVCRKYSFAGA